jgi:hypothetical protein
MKKFIVAICMLLVSTAAFSQTRSRTTSKRVTASAKTQKASAQAAAEVKLNGATRVADQIKNLTTFLYLLGGVAKEMDAQDATSKSGQTSPTIERNKAKFKSTFEDFRMGLDKLEIDFRNTPELQPYYVKLAGSASGAANAEDQASAGHADQAGHTLLTVVNRLTDVLLAMR